MIVFCNAVFMQPGIHFIRLYVATALTQSQAIPRGHCE